MKTLISRVVTLLVMAAFASLIVHADPIIYATGNSGAELLRIDVGSSNVTVVGSTGFQRALAITIHPYSGVYTAINSGSSNTGTPQLAKVDLTTGRATVFGSTTPRLMGMTWLPDGRLLGVDARWGNSFYAVDPASGNATRLGAPGAGGDIMDMAWHPDGTLYAIEPTALYRVDPALGKRTFVKSIWGLSNPMGLAIDYDGTFYAAESAPAASIFHINPATGQATRVLRTGVDYVHGLDIAPRPAVRTTVQNGQFDLSWPAWAAGYVLQSATSPRSDAVWTPIANLPVQVDDRMTIRHDMLAPQQFFRLIRP